jgi:hypothetical protein
VRDCTAANGFFSSVSAHYVCLVWLWQQCSLNLPSLLKGVAGDAAKDLRRLADAALEVPALQNVSDVAERAAKQTQKLASSVSTPRAKVTGSGGSKAGSNGSTADNVASARKWIEDWRASTKKKADKSKYPIKV